MERKAMSHRQTLLLLVFMDHIGIGLVIPLIVPLMRDLGAKQMQQGLISSIYGILQLIGSPFMGLLSDREGRREALLISYVGTAFGYFILGFSSSLQILMLSRLLSGLLKHSSNATRAYIADHTTRSNRAIELGRMATASGLGMMIGPTVSGFLFKLGGYSLPTTLSSALFVTNVAILLSRFPSELPPSTKASPPERGEARYRSVFPKVSILWRPRVAALFTVRVLLGLGVQIFRQGFSMLLLYRFNLGVQWNGLFISYQGLLTSLVQGLAIKPLSNRFSDGTLIARGIFILGAAYATTGIVPNTVLLAVVLTPVALSSGVVRTTYISVLTSSVPPNEVGQVLGLADAVMSICRILGPTLAGYFSQTYGPSSPALLSGVLVAGAGIVFIFLGLAGPSPPQLQNLSFPLSPRKRPDSHAFSNNGSPFEESLALLPGSRLESPALHRNSSGSRLESPVLHRNSSRLTNKRLPPGDRSAKTPHTKETSEERGDNSYGSDNGGASGLAVAQDRGSVTVSPGERCLERGSGGSTSNKSLGDRGLGSFSEKGASGLGSRDRGGQVSVSLGIGSERGLGGSGSSGERGLGDVQIREDNRSRNTTSLLPL